MTGVGRSEQGPVLLALHIPKTGGTTLAKIVYSEFARAGESDGDRPSGWIGAGIYYFRGALLLAENEVASFFERETRGVSAEVVDAIRREDVKLITGHFSFGLHEHLQRPSSYVTLLRHPVDRVSSLYYHVLKHPDYSDFHRYVVSNEITLEEFVSGLTCKEADNGQVRRISGRDPEFGGCSTEMLEEAKANLRNYFALVGVTERFNETLVLLSRTLGWQLAPYVPQQVNPTRPSRDSLPAKVKEVIMRHNDLDLDLYHYGSSLLDAAIGDQDTSFEREVKEFDSLNVQHIETHRWWQTT